MIFYIFGVLLLLFLIFLSALFSFSEMSISSVNKIKIKNIIESKDSTKKEKKQAKKVIYFIENYNEHISSIVIFNNIVNILFTTFATVYFTVIAKDLGNEIYGPITSFFLMTPIVILFGEIVPKQLAKKFPEIGSMKLSWTLQIVNIVMKPITILIGKIIKEEKEKTLLSSVEEINIALRDSTNAGITTEFEQNIIKKTLEIDNSKIINLMILKKNVITLPVDISIKKIDDILKKTNHTRFPVISKKGEVKSIFFAKKYIMDRIKNTLKSLDKYMYDFISFQIDDNPFYIFETLRSRREKMGIILNKEKKFVGIITIEDIIELILGKIYDEGDIEKDGVYLLNESSFIVDSEVNVGYFIKNYFPSLKTSTIIKSKNFNELIKEISGNDPIIDEYYVFKNMIIWSKEDKLNDNKIIFEIDII